MKKIILLVFVILIFPLISALSLYSAQDISKEYMQSNEFLDSSVYFVKCDANQYYVIGVVDGKGDLSFFVPIESNNGNVLYQSTENTKNVLKTAQVYRAIKTTDSRNYLSLQLLDKIDNLNTILKSKSARYDGIIRSNYSSNITQKTTVTKNNLDTLISQLDTLYSNLQKLQKDQDTFLDTSDCKKTDLLLQSYKNSFAGYNKLISDSVKYRDSVNDIIEAVVADKTQDEITKRTILSHIDAPNNLNSEISAISDYLSSTNQFYLGIVSEFEKTGVNSSTEILLTKIKARHDFYLTKSALYSYDSELKDNLNSQINYILNENNINYWKDRTTVKELSQNYNQIIDLYNKGRYSESLSKISQAKNQVKKITREGIIEYEEKTNYTYLIFTVSGLLLLLLIIFLFKKFGKIKKVKTKKHIDEEPDFLRTKRDPFK